jgi:hypothetical protein
MGRPIKPKTPPLPNGPNMIPGRIPATTPDTSPTAGPPYNPAMKTPIREKSKATPGAIWPITYVSRKRTFPRAPIIKAKVSFLVSIIIGLIAVDNYLRVTTHRRVPIFAVYIT